MLFKLSLQKFPQIFSFLLTVSSTFFDGLPQFYRVEIQALDTQFMTSVHWTPEWENPSQ